MGHSAGGWEPRERTTRRAAPAAARARSPARRAAGPGRSRRAPRSAPPLPPPPAGARSARHAPPEVFQPRAGGPDPLRDVHALVEPGEAERGTRGWGPEPNFHSVAPPGPFPLCCGRSPPGASRRQAVPASRARIAKGLFPSARKRAGREQLTEHADPLPGGTPLSLRHSEAPHFS